MLDIPGRRYSSWIKNIFFLFIVVKFVIIDYTWF
jgi:hypothetical protein